MKRPIALFVLTCLLAPALFAAKGELGEMTAICRVSFTKKTQAGEIPCHVAVCTLDSAVGASAELYVVTAFEREYAPRIVRILEGGHSPVIEKTADRISILFTRGVNSTCVAEFSLAKGTLTFVSQEEIAWNDSGIYRTSASFPKYAHLLKRRNDRKQ